MWLGLECGIAFIAEEFSEKKAGHRVGVNKFVLEKRRF
jgi:hypothetical protein